MYYTVEFDITSFEFWGGATSTIEDVRKAYKMNELESLIEDVFSDRENVSETDINDFVWFEEDMIKEYLGIQEELSESERFTAIVESLDRYAEYFDEDLGEDFAKQAKENHEKYIYDEIEDTDDKLLYAFFEEYFEGLETEEDIDDRAYSLFNGSDDNHLLYDSERGLYIAIMEH